MIVIKIKTWKDWKKDFLDWVQAPRRSTCKEYVDYMEALQNQVLYKKNKRHLRQIRQYA